MIIKAMFKFRDNTIIRDNTFLQTVPNLSQGYRKTLPPVLLKAFLSLQSDKKA